MSSYNYAILFHFGVFIFTILVFPCLPLPHDQQLELGCIVFVFVVVLVAAITDVVYVDFQLNHHEFYSL